MQRQDLFTAAKIAEHAAGKIPGHTLAPALQAIAAALLAEAKATPPKVAVGTECGASPASRASGTFGGAPEPPGGTARPTGPTSPTGPTAAAPDLSAEAAPAAEIRAAQEPSFAAILTAEGSDKATRHRYTPVYLEEFSRFQGVSSRILEIGVKEGASLRAYKRMLPLAELWGIDVRPPSQDTPGHLIIADGYAAETWAQLPQFDLIIEDGSHRPADMLRGLPHFLAHLAPGGTLLIEDIPTEQAALDLLNACPGGELTLTEPTSKRHDDRIFRYHKPGPPVDLIVPLGTGSQSDNDELKILLRSAEKYCPDLGKVWIATTAPPPWLTGAEVVEVPDSNKHNKDANLIRKLLACCERSTADKVVRCSDDQVFLRPCRLNSLPLFRRDKAPDTFGDGKWSRRMKHTGEFLAARGLPLAVTYDTHCPQAFPRQMPAALLQGVDWSGEQLCINTLLMGLRGCTWGAPYTRYKVTYESEAKEYPLAPELWFAGYMDGAFLHGLREQLFQLFPEKSRFEKC